MSVFYDHMQAVMDFYKELEAGEVNYTDFIRLQRFEERINNARKTGYYNNMQYKSIHSAWLDLMDGYRDAIAAQDPTYAAANNRQS